MKELEVMTKEEIQEQIKDLEERMFYLDMQEHWEKEDYEISKEWNEKIHILKNKLEEM